MELLHFDHKTAFEIYLELTKTPKVKSNYSYCEKTSIFAKHYIFIVTNRMRMTVSWMALTDLHSYQALFYAPSHLLFHRASRYRTVDGFILRPWGLVN